MTIDDYNSAVSLSHQLDASTPFTVRPGKPLLKMMKEKGTPMTATRDYVVEKVMYSGDDGGIVYATRQLDRQRDCRFINDSPCN